MFRSITGFLLLFVVVLGHGDEGDAPLSKEGAATSSGHNHTHGFLIKAHGTLLTLTFSVMFPLGTILIRAGLKKGFLLHWSVQLGSTLTAIAAMLLMLIRSWKYIIVSVYTPTSLQT